MTEKQVIAQMANNILTVLNIEQIVGITKDFALQQAEKHYHEMPPKEQEELKEKFEAARAEMEKPEIVT